MKLGFIDIEHSTPILTQGWVPCDFSVINANKQDQHKLRLISKLVDANIIEYSDCLLIQTHCFVLIHLHLNILLFPHLNTFIHLLSFVSQDTGCFFSVFGSITYSGLLDIFHHLPSPALDSDGWDNIHSIIPGMKTVLYQYQKNSLHKILEREFSPKEILKPEIIKIKALDGTCYLNRLTGSISESPEYTKDVMGGIICEDMGTGKTCLCLAVVMATKDITCPLPVNRSLKTNLDNRGSLKRLAAEGVLKSGINWKSIEDRLPPDVVDWFHDYPLYYEWLDVPDHFDFSRSRRIMPQFTTLTVYVSNTTLIIVPDNLVAQWTGEIYKHIQDGQLNFSVHDDIKQKINPSLELINQDVILISQSRFSFENQQGGLDFTSKLCQCPYIGSTRDRACICSIQPDPYVSPLLKVHWKRVIVDEGHRLSQRNKLSELARKLFCHWRWICTGTPTQHLTLTHRTFYEADDLKRLGQLLAQVGLEPFQTDMKLWNKWIVQPFVKKAPWAILQCADILSRTMIRHQRKDIEREVTLPPLYQKTVYLEFDDYQWLAHNCQVAMISLNAILSQREGPDYLFSSKNYKSLRETLHNLWQSCLWHSIEPKLLVSAYENCVEKCIEIEQGKADYGSENEDMFRIRSILEEANRSEIFLHMMNQPSPAWIVQGLPEDMERQLTWGAHLMQANQGAQKMKDWASSSDPSLLEAKVIGATSSKLNYLVNQIVKFQATEKCIIFAQHHNERVEIYLMLERLTKMRILIYHENKMTNAQRSNIILTFNTSDNANVIIMPVRKAAYGIDLSSATRVFFVSPVWETSAEQQAIKRAHRIGQTRPVYVETLVIRNTIEDELLKRREEAQSKEFFEDHKLKYILSHARFVPRHNALVLFEQPFYFIPRKNIKLSTETRHVDVDDGLLKRKVVDVEPKNLPEKKKKKSVGFSL